MSEALHLVRRKNVWYYRRRVPDHLVGRIGRPVIQYSLKTADKKTAKQRREIEDVKWSARFEAAEGTEGACSDDRHPLSGATATELVANTLTGWIVDSASGRTRTARPMAPNRKS